MKSDRSDQDLETRFLEQSLREKKDGSSMRDLTSLIRKRLKTQEHQKNGDDMSTYEVEREWSDAKKETRFNRKFWGLLANAACVAAIVLVIVSFWNNGYFSGKSGQDQLAAPLIQDQDEELGIENWDFTRGPTLVITITAPIPANPDPSVWTESKRQEANKVMVEGRSLSFAELKAVLIQNGVQNVKFRDPKRPNLSNRSVLIRCDQMQSFDYVKTILELLASPKIAIYKIDMATFDHSQDTLTTGETFNTDLPVDMPPVEEEEVEAKESNTLAGKARQNQRFAVVKLVQKKSGSLGSKLKVENTAFFFAGEEISGSTTSEILKNLRAKLQSHHAAYPLANGQIHASPGVPHGNVLRVLDVFRQAQFESPTFVGSNGNKDFKSQEARWKKLRKQFGQDR